MSITEISAVPLCPSTKKNRVNINWCQCRALYIQIRLPTFRSFTLEPKSNLHTHIFNWIWIFLRNVFTQKRINLRWLFEFSRKHFKAVSSGVVVCFAGVKFHSIQFWSAFCKMRLIINWSTNVWMAVNLISTINLTLLVVTR